MPKGSIKARRAFFTKVRTGYKLIDWYAVDTSLGAMVEPRPVLELAGGKVVDIDAQENAVSSFTYFNEDKFFTQYLTGGNQVPVDYNTK